MGCKKEQKKKPQGSLSAREDTVTFLCHMYFETATTVTNVGYSNESIEILSISN